MLIGLLSDTHIAFPYETIPSQVKDVFDGVDLILHAGDIWIPSVLDALESVAPVKSAWGDDDSEDDFAGDNRMMQGMSLELEGITIWLRHVKPRYGLISPNGDTASSKPDVEPLARPDVVVYGHSHFANMENYKGVLLINPGSVTWPNYIPKLGSVALLTIDSGEVEAHIVQLDGQSGTP
jgi:putative phosphoesterase